MPGITIKPPCGPRIYKKLYQYLDTALPATSIPLLTPRKSARTFNPSSATSSHAQTPPSARTPLSNITPSKRALDSDPATPTPNRRRDLLGESAKKRRLDNANAVLSTLTKTPTKPASATAGPPWLPSVANHLTRKLASRPFSAPEALSQASRHVLTGITDISRNQRYADEEVASLSIAVTLLVLAKAGKLDGDQVKKKCMEGSQQLVALRRIGISRMGIVASDVGRWVEEEGEAWKGMAWYAAVEEDADEPSLDGAREDTHSRPSEPVPTTPSKNPVSVQVPTRTPLGSRDLGNGADQADAGGDRVLEGESDGTDDWALHEDETEAPELPQKVPASERASAARGGLGTMFQDAVDFLSDERQAQYASWKASIMRRISAMERRQARAQRA